MKVIMIGGSGAMAQVVLRDLLQFADPISVTLADLRPVDVQDPRVKSVVADVKDEEGTARLVDGHDVLLNCATYYLNVPVMRAALRARVPYSDLGGLYHGSVKQFALHDDFVKAELTAVLGMGSTPGITNVMAGAMSRKMDRVDELHVRVACQDKSASGPLPIPYALDTVLDEFAMEPMVFTEGRPKAVPPMSGAETLEFPEPIGRVEALYTLHSEVAMFPRSFPDLKEASFKVAFPGEFTQKVKFLVELGFSSRDKSIRDVSPREVLLALAGRQVVPAGDPNDCDGIRVEAKGMKDGKAVRMVAESIILPHPEWKIAAGSLDTGVPLSILGQMLANRLITKPGVLCPETCVPPEPFFAELRKRHITVSY